MLLSGLPMHRIKGTDPHQDTLNKVKTVRPLVGRVLDTATGLGYTAIEAARTAEQVTTIVLDPAVLTIARRNPWSRELFDNPKITQVIGDSFEQAPLFADNTFSVILHDPPMFHLAGDLYSGEFYRQLWRILKNTGRLFHYIGELESSSFFSCKLFAIWYPLQTHLRCENPLKSSSLALRRTNDNNYPVCKHQNLY